MKKILILVFILFNLLNINSSFAWGWFSWENKIEKKISKYVEDLDYEQRRTFWKTRSDYKKYSALYETEIYKEKYKIWTVNKENKEKYLKKKEETLEKIEKLDENIAKLLKDYKGNYSYRVNENLLKELKIRQYIETTVEDSPKSFYKQIFKLWEDNPYIALEDFSEWENNFKLPKEFKNTIYIVKRKNQKDFNSWNSWVMQDLDLISSIEFWENKIYNKNEFQKLDFQKIKFDVLKKNWIEIDFTKEFKDIKDKNIITVSIFVEYNWLYLELEWNNITSLDNTKKWKLNYLKNLYYKKNWINNDYDFREQKSSCNNKFLNDKIKRIIDNLEKKINNKEKFNALLLKIRKKIEIIKSKYKENWLKIAWKINQNSDISKIIKEYEKYMYKWEVLEILWKYVWFKSKENYYDSTIDEIFMK